MSLATPAGRTTATREPRQKRRHRAAAFTSAVLLTLAGCGTSGGAALDSAPSEPKTTADRLLTTDDLGDGWTDVALTDPGDNPVECLAAIGEVGGETKERAEFAGPGGEPELNQVVVPDAAAFDTFVGLFDGCGSFDAESDGLEFSGTVSAAEVEPIDGLEELAAYRLVATTSTGAVAEGYYLLLRQGDNTSGLSFRASPSVDTNQAREVAETAAEKLGD